MNTDKINHHLAVEVMRWHEDRSDLGFNKFGNKKSPWDYVDQDGIFTCCIHKWKPDINLDQAFMCLDAFDWVTLSRSKVSNEWSVTVQDDTRLRCWNKSLPMAISLAIYKATGGEE